MNAMACDIEKLNLKLGSKFLQAYLECSDEIQAGIRDMLAILSDPDSDADDCDMALHTLADALFPNPHEGKLGLDLLEAEQMGAEYSEQTAQVLASMDEQEATFADRLRGAMEAKGLNQEALAVATGVGQPAISNMLNRQCRPQRRTVLRFAEALGVAPENLWPSMTER